MSKPSVVVVRRCTVRVVRCGGWSWGPQPRHLVDQVVAALPGLIEGRLAALAVADDVEITEPVRIRVTLPLDDVLAGRVGPALGDTAVLEPLPEPVAIHQASALPVGTPLADFSDLPHPLVPDVPTPGRPATLLEFLTALHERGEARAVLAFLPAATLRLWYDALFSWPGRAPARPINVAIPPEVFTALSRVSSDDLAVPAQDGERSSSEEQTKHLRDALLALASLAADVGVPEAARFVRMLVKGQTAHPTGAEQQGATDGTAAEPCVDAAGPAELIASGAAGTPLGGATASQRPPVSPPGTRPRATSMSATVVEVPSALPFLLLGPLAWTGYLHAIAPALEPVGMETATPAFATALAYTVLGPLERGWRRLPGDVTTAAAFAGLDRPLPEPVLVEFARVGVPALPVLDTLIARALVEGHTAGEPLVLASAGGGFLLVDREGLFPLAWTDNVADLLPVWRVCGSPLVLVGLDAAAALNALQDAGVRFVVGVPPTRHERWRRLPPPRRLWTNDHELAPAMLSRLAAGHAEAVERLADLVQALTVLRNAVPLAASPALARSLLLAAGLGLGTIAWTLWRDRERTDPLLALERFGDLSARVTFGADSVHVCLPLGRRHADLFSGGLLADVPDVPWLAGRVLEFSGG